MRLEFCGIYADILALLWSFPAKIFYSNGAALEARHPSPNSNVELKLVFCDSVVLELSFTTETATATADSLQRHYNLIAFISLVLSPLIEKQLNRLTAP